MTLTPFERALVAHLVADWLLQTNWMVVNKTNLRHPAGWVHAGIHGVCLGVALGWLGGVVLGAVHLLLDTRRPVEWWMRVVKKDEESAEARVIALVVDQVIHLTTIAAWVVMVGG
jgi:hypothetical protein